MALEKPRVVVVGISGATCSGKTTIAKELKDLLPNSKVFSQDNYFFPVDSPHHVWIPELKHINWDIVSSLDMERMTQDVEQYAAKYSSVSPPKISNKVQNSVAKIVQSNCQVLIVEGFCVFNYKPLADLCDLKYYFTLDFEECFKRRVKRVYEPPDVPGYFKKCVWPEHLKQLDEVRNHISNVKFFDENSTNQLQEILTDIAKLL